MGERAECGRRGDAMLKRKSLRERQAKLTSETSITLAEMVSATKPNAAFLTASVPSHVKQTVIQQRSECQGVTSSKAEDGVPVRHTKTELGDPLSNARLVGDELTLGSGTGREGGNRPQWTQQRCLPQGERATLVGKDGDNLKSYKSLCVHENDKSHKSGELQLLLVKSAGDVTRKRDHSAAADHDTGSDMPPRLARLSCHKLVQKVTKEAACSPRATVASSSVPSPVARFPGILAGISWWPTLAIFLGLVLPTTLGLPAVIRIGKY